MSDVRVVNVLGGPAQESRRAAFRPLDQAGESGMPVGDLRDALNIPLATATAHHNILRSAGLVIDQLEERGIRVRADHS